MEKLQARNLFGEITRQEAVKVRDGREYWIKEILGHVRETNSKATFKSIMWRINKSLISSKLNDVRDLHFAIMGAMKDPRCPYATYSHAFDARTKI